MKINLKKFLEKLTSLKYFLPPDVFERHKFIASLIPNESEILDVGGSMSQLNKFMKAKKITTADIKPPADIVYDGKKIPVKDSSYSVITSIDVLEHIEERDREGFVEELNRVGTRKIIISAPFGTSSHSKYEKDVLRHYESKGIKLPYLEEHVKIGLPAPSELKNFQKNFGGEVYYSGDIRLTDKLFKIHNFEVKNPYINYAVFFSKLFFNLIMNVFGYYFIVNRREGEYVNRFYFVIDK